jgi:tetratricopeptide (TPR) repeat protein
VAPAEVDLRVPGYLGRVLDVSGSAAGTCFQVSPGVVATAWHVLDAVGGASVGDTVRIDALGGDSEPWDATVHATDELADLAVLRTSGRLGSSIVGLRSTDGVELEERVVVTGVSEVDDPGHEFRFLDAPGSWAGGTTKDDSLPLGRMSSTDVVRGMSGAPVRRADGDAVVGVVSGRYNSADGWLAGSVWVARSEQLQVLCLGLTDLELENALATSAVELVLTVGESEVRLKGDGVDVTAAHQGAPQSLNGVLDDLSRGRTRAASARDQAGATAGAEVEVALQRAGQLLAEAFLPDPLSARLEAELERAEGGHQALRLGIVCDARFSGLPWEALPDPRGDGPLVLNPLASVDRRFPRALGPQAPGPLRILVAIASPDRSGDPDLDYERELRNVVAAVRAARQGDAHVRIVQFATTSAIRAALEVEPVHVLHLSGHGGPGKFTFEDDEGNPRPLGPDEFVDEAIPPGAMPAVVALAACHSNVSEAAAVPSFAVRMLQRGASVVVASETSLTDVYATRVFSRFYGYLANAPRPEAVGALADARRAVQAELESATDERERQLGNLNEWAVLSTVAVAGAVPVLDPTEQTPTVAPPPRFTIGSVAARQVGDFVGRRREQREWPSELVAPNRAGLVLHGIGGVGKTTLAAELVGRVLEKEPARVRAVFSGELTVEKLLGQLSAALRRSATMSGHLQGDLANALATAGRGDVPWSDRLAILREFVFDAMPCLVVLDNFEDNLDYGTDGATVAEPTVAELLADWISDPGLSRILITCRHPFELPRSAHERLAFKSVGPLSAAETSKLIWSLPALDRLSPADVERVWRLVGGHPRSLEYLDALLSGSQGRYPDITKRLRKAVSDRLGPTRASAFFETNWRLDDAMAEVATIAADDVLLSRLIETLGGTEGAEDLLVGMSVYREPVDMNGALFQVGEPGDDAGTLDPSEIEERIESALAAAGVDSSKRAVPDDLPPAVRDEIGSLLEMARRPPRSAPEGLGEMVEACVASSLLGMVEGDGETGLFVHRWTAGELERGANAAGEAEKIAAAHRRAAEYWQWRVAVWPQSVPADIHDLLEARFHYLKAGELDQVIAITESACSQLDEWGAWDDETTLVHDMLAQLPEGDDREAAWLSQLGNIALRRGDFDAAESLYRRSLEIKESVDDQRGVANSYGQLGTLHKERGELDEAESHYRRALDIQEQIDDRRGMATAFHQLGIVAENRNEFDQAEPLYRRSLEIEEELENEAGIASSYGQLGNLALRRGEPDQAEAHYRRGLEIEERLGILPGMATTYHQLGILAHQREELDVAEPLYRQSLMIEERLGAQAGVADSYGQLADLAHDRGELDESESLYRRCLEINVRLGIQPRIADSLSRLAVICDEQGKVEENVVLTGQALALWLRLESGKGFGDAQRLRDQRESLGTDALRTMLGKVLGEGDVEVLLDVLEKLPEPDDQPVLEADESS